MTVEDRFWEEIINVIKLYISLGLRVYYLSNSVELKLDRPIVPESDQKFSGLNEDILYDREL